MKQLGQIKKAILRLVWSSSHLLLKLYQLQHPCPIGSRSFLDLNKWKRVRFVFVQHNSEYHKMSSNYWK